MDTLTHALSGALLARATAPAVALAGGPSTRQRMLIGFLAAAAPDLDVIASYTTPLAYLYNHRGVTHSLLMLPLWALLLAALWTWLHHRAVGRWRDYAGICALGIAVHIAGDLITSFGTMIFAPLSDARYAWSTTFIIDLWLSAILLAGLAALAYWRASRLPALLGCALVVGYIGFQSIQRDRAAEFGADYARAAGLTAVEVSALPRPLSPFNWMVVVQERDRTHYAEVSLSRQHASNPPAPGAGFFEQLGAPYRPLADALWVTRPRYGEDAGERAVAEEAWRAPAFAFFRWFANYPVFFRLDRGADSVCAWFEDLRFITPGRAGVPFRYGMCRSAGGAWQAHELHADGSRVPVY
jgi:inner membrane protein